MLSDEIQKLQNLIKDSELLKKEAINKDDPRFSSWHEKARQTIAQKAPVKRFAFEEISFASDFFLSKTITEREGINDRIALVSDLQLAVKLFKNVISIFEKELSKEKLEILDKDSMSENTSGFSNGPDIRWQQVLKKIESADFSNREKFEVKEILKGLQSSLQDSEKDWDRFKRGIKFFLDFDRKLALEVVPFLLEVFKSSIERPNN